MSASGGDPAGCWRHGGTRDADERERREKKDGITRRDFLDGAAVSAAGLAAAAAFPGLTGAEAMAHGGGDPGCRPSYYPPSFSDPFTGQPRPGDPAHDQDRRAAAVEAQPGALDQGRPRHPRAREGHAREVRLRDRRRRRQRDLGGEVVPGPLRPGEEDPDHRPAARLRRPLAPQRVAHPERGQRRRRREDPAQRRHGQPRQHRHAGTATPRAASPAPTASRRSTSSPGRASTSPTRRSGRTAAPPASPRSFGLYQRLLFPAAEFGTATT